MGLKEIDGLIRRVYDSDEVSILEEFFIPVMEQSKYYYRLSGFFSSKALTVASRGIKSLIENNGCMKLIVHAKFSEEDLEAIRKGLKKIESLIEKNAIDELAQTNEEIFKDHLTALSWLISTKKLEIKVAVVMDKDGIPLKHEEVEKRGIFHPKIGIFVDAEDNMLSFSGSDNESENALVFNIEDVKTFRNWEKGEQKYFEEDYKRFFKFWNDKGKRTKVYDISTAVKKHLVETYKPKSKDEVIAKLEKWEKPKPFLLIQKNNKKIKINPWHHQIEAISAFRDNEYNGILKMATGTGKTFNALFCLKDYFNNIQNLCNRILVIVPQKNLANQWKNDLKTIISKEDLIISFHSGVKQEKRRNALKIWKRNFNIDSQSNIYLIITIDSVDNFTSFRVRKPNFIIADEVHTYGTKNRIRILNRTFPDVKYKLALSATPERYYDSEGTEDIIDFFGKIIYSYDMKQAQNDKILSDYYYYPSLTNLTKEEEDYLVEITGKISKKIAIHQRDLLSENESKLPESVKRLIIKRALIIKLSRNKLDSLRDILKNNDKILKQCIVYCENSNQLEEVQTLFDELNIISYVRYTSMMKTREEALNIFKKKNCRYILSMHCLDQGVNIPSCESLILMSSSTNPREYIQRRGRVLRNPIGKIKPSVKIFDILSFPLEVSNSYRGMIVSQIVRAWEFIRCSDSPEAKIHFRDIKEKFDITNQELKQIIEEW